MNVIDKRKLSKEAEMQIKALKKINRWKIIALAVSTLGVAAAYAGFAASFNPFSLAFLVLS